MKNQKFLFTDLPTRISTRRSLVERYGSIWNTRLDYKYSTKRSIYKLALDIVKANVGKLHDTAYSYFRKKSKYMHTYWDYAGAWEQAFKRFFYKGRIQTTFFVDDEGLIQKKVRHFKFIKNKKPEKYFTLKVFWLIPILCTFLSITGNRVQVVFPQQNIKE